MYTRNYDTGVAGANSIRQDRIERPLLAVDHVVLILHVVDALVNTR
jgi:hypothetical protein